MASQSKLKTLGLAIVAIVAFIIISLWIWDHHDYPIIRIPDRLTNSSSTIRGLNEKLFDIHLNLQSAKRDRRHRHALRTISFPDTYWKFINYLEDPSKADWEGVIHFRSDGTIEVRGDRFRNEFSNAEFTHYERPAPERIIFKSQSGELNYEMWYPYYRDKNHTQFEISPINKNYNVESYLMKQPGFKKLFYTLPPSL